MIAMGLFVRRILPFLIVSSTALCQLPSSRCDSAAIALADCPFQTGPGPQPVMGQELPTVSASGSLVDENSAAPERGGSNAFISPVRNPTREHFHWGRSLFESFTYFSIAQAYVVHDDYRWVVTENGVPFNHYWRDYKQSLNTWLHSGWDDGDPKLYSYVGHPNEGALTAFIQIQNDPQGRNLELENSKAYWWSRFKAFWFAAAFSTQWSIGPLSELTVEKYGTKARNPWNHNGTWPCYQHCVTGVGQVDLVVTPIAGVGWVLGEDFLDKAVARRVEAHTQNLFLIDVTRSALDPIRSGANVLHGKRPWYRSSRDAHQVYFSRHIPQP
jgi:hypothetical protein